FNSVSPSQNLFGTTPNFGAINQVSGPDVQLQAQAANDFVAIPEPSSIIPALTAATMIPSFLYLRCRRSRKTDA
ncbi:MAG: PEP-CTERM sorting domain-containing protein, partial [Planctomycetaceae bacterium]|nr:PEP-CTERM sorting domain-containing protein [Planctomycetaceae bacterium]